MLGRRFARMELGNAGLDVLDDAVGAVGGENAQTQRTISLDSDAEKALIGNKSRKRDLAAVERNILHSLVAGLGNSPVDSVFKGVDIKTDDILDKEDDRA